jgi:hypothetical protein
MLVQGIHCDIYECAYNILVSSTPPSFSLFPLLRTISTDFSLLFSWMDIKYIHHIHLIPPFFVLFPIPLLPISGKDLLKFTLTASISFIISGPATTFALNYTQAAQRCEDLNTLTPGSPSCLDSVPVTV